MTCTDEFAGGDASVNPTLTRDDFDLLAGWRQGDVSLVSFSLLAELATGTGHLSPLRLRFAADKWPVPMAPGMLFSWARPLASIP